MGEGLFDSDLYLQTASTEELGQVLPTVCNIAGRIDEMLKYDEYQEEESVDIRTRQFFETLLETIERPPYDMVGAVMIEDMYFRASLRGKVFTALHRTGDLQNIYTSIYGDEAMKISDLPASLRKKNRALAAKEKLLGDCLTDMEFFGRFFQKTKYLRADMLHFFYMIEYEDITPKKRLQIFSHLFKYTQTDQLLLEILQGYMARDIEILIDPDHPQGFTKLQQTWQYFHDIIECDNDIYQMAFPVFKQLIDATISQEKDALAGFIYLEKFYGFIKGKDKNIQKYVGERVEEAFNSAVSIVSEMKGELAGLRFGMDIHKNLLKSKVPEYNIRIALEKIIEKLMAKNPDIRYCVWIIDLCKYCDTLCDTAKHLSLQELEKGLKKK